MSKKAKQEKKLKDAKKFSEMVVEQLKASRAGGSTYKKTKCIAGSGAAGYLCSVTSTDFDCSNDLGAFGCAKPYKCPSHFGCEGGWFDDFECMGGGSFHCGRVFKCTYSFDDEDCQHGGGHFTCGKGFECGGSGEDYN